MDPQQYGRLKDKYLDKIRAYFPDSTVRCLVEAPEKSDHGDIDIFVTLSAEQKVDFEDLGNKIGAAGVILHSSGTVRKCTLGVAADGTSSESSVIVYQHNHGHGEGVRSESAAALTTKQYAQIDIEIVAPHLAAWFSFYSSSGDMLGLIGRIVRNLGFIVTDRGLWLRMPELDASKTMTHVNVADRDGIIFLSNDPHRVMLFLGLSVDRYEAGFETLEELYTWLGACRMLSAEVIRLKRENSSERNREHKRSVFSGFFNEWLPLHMDMTLEQDEVKQRTKLLQLRHQFLEGAVLFFEKSEEYAAKHSALVRAINNATAGELLKPLVAEYSQRDGKKLNEVMRSFRRNVGFNEVGDPYVLDTSHSDINSQLHRFLGDDSLSLRDETAARIWVKANWEQLRILERQTKKTSTGE